MSPVVLINRLWDAVARMPSTNVRIVVTLVMAMATAVRVVVFSWTPPVEWLGFLTLWAGLDVAQFGTKRSTETGYVAAKQGAPLVNPPTPPEIGA